MLQIHVLSVQTLKEKKFVAFMMFVKNAINDDEFVQQSFPFFVNKFRTAYGHLDDVFLKYDIDACTRAVHEADNARDIAFRKMRDQIKWFITYPETVEKTQAAEELMRVIDLYGGINIPSQGLTAKTATLTNLVDDIENKFSTEVEILGVGTWIEELKAAQESFDEKYMARDVCESEIGKGAMAEARKEMTDAYRLLVDAINLKVHEGTEGQLSDFIKLMNVEIGKNRIYTGQGQVGSTSGSGTGSENETARVKTATFNFKNGNSIKLRLEVGAPIEVPENTEGYMWKPEVPEFMPEKNCTFKEVPIAKEEFTATFHFFDHREEEIRQLAGSILNAPANTTGYVWQPTVPETMPAEDTAYYEMPAAQTEPTKYTIAFIHNGNTVASYELEAGAAITDPTAPTGYHWVNVPASMPAENISITTAADEEPPILS